MEHPGFRITLLIVLILVTAGLIANAVQFNSILERGGCGSQMSTDEARFMTWVNIILAIATTVLCIFVIYKMYIEHMTKDPTLLPDTTSKPGPTISYNPKSFNDPISDIYLSPR